MKNLIKKIGMGATGTGLSVLAAASNIGCAEGNYTRSYEPSTTSAITPIGVPEGYVPFPQQNGIILWYPPKIASQIINSREIPIGPPPIDAETARKVELWHATGKVPITPYDAKISRQDSPQLNNDLMTREQAQALWDFMKEYVSSDRQTDKK